MKIQKHCFTDDIPDDIFIKILSKLPGKTLIRSMCVCKGWKLFIIKNKTHLINTHLRQSSTTKYSIISYLDLNDRSPKLKLLRDKTLEDLELPILKCLQLDDIYVFTFGFVGSCNGLVCFNHWHDCTVLWNPITRDKRLIPDPIFNSNSNELDYHQSFTYNHKYQLLFGFDHINNDYKLVRVTQEYCSFELRVQIFRLSTNSWREVKGISDYEMSLYRNNFKIVNGVLYLLGDQHIRGDEINTCILQFDLCFEEFQEILDLPSACKNEKWITFSQWRESFAVAEQLSEGLFEQLEYNFWIMNDGLPGTQTYSWTKLFKITSCSSCDYTSYFMGTYKDQLVFDKYVIKTNHSELTLLDAIHHEDYMNYHTIIYNFGASEDPTFSYTFDYIESLISVDPHS